VLIVDDEPEVRALARVVLEVSGIDVDVDEAADGETAIAAVNRQLPDLVVVDKMMPKLDGMATCRALLAQHPGLSLALCSAAMDGAMAHEAEAAGIRWCLNKHELTSLPDLLDELAVA
jgi:CheY-like chemotaxis protein